PELTAKLAAFDAQIAARQKTLSEKTSALAYVDPASLKPPPPVQDSETVWLDDDFPPGAKVAYAGKWVTLADGSPIHSGQRSLKRSGGGIVQDYYESGAEPL